MSGLKASISKSLAYKREVESRRFGATDEDIRIARQSGFDPQDVMTIRQFTRSQNLVIIFRCPKIAARALHGTFPGKTAATASKTSNDSGTVVDIERGIIMVSDYDLMSCWKTHDAGTFEKIPISAKTPGAKRGAWEPEARDLVRALNSRLITRIQHGAQDDWNDINRNPGVKSEDNFLIFASGKADLFFGPESCKRYYDERSLHWPYRPIPNGKYLGSIEKT